MNQENIRFLREDYIIRFLLALKVPTHCLKGETFILFSKKINKKVLKIFVV